MSRVLERLNVLAICVLGGVLGAVLILQICPRGRALAQAGTAHDQPRLPKALEDEWRWPKTLQVYPAHPGDPVKLVRIIKAGQEIEPGKYSFPDISGDHFLTPNPMDDWLKDTSFVLENQSFKTIVSVGVSVILPARQTNADCHFAVGGVWARDPFCDVNPGWCDGGCPVLIHRTVSWGRIPAGTASGLKARYRAEGRRVSPYVDEGEPLEGKGWLRLAPGEETALSLVGRGDSWMSVTDPRHGFSDSVNGILFHEGIDEAKDVEPCLRRLNSKKGCAFSEVSKFNIGLDVAYFEDGTIWGNYGYGYALPSPDGIFRRVEARDLPRLAPLPGAPN
jgi:hypothetical protein